MGIDLYVRWKGGVPVGPNLRVERVSKCATGSRAYLVQPAHRDPYALWYLVPECFEDTTRKECEVRAETLIGRLPQVVAVVEQRERVLYGSDQSDTAEVVQNFREFIRLCELIQQQTEKAVTIGVSY